MNSRVHPSFKTRYRATNWPEYERGLVQRGDVTVWMSIEAIGAWRAGPTGKRGAQPKFSDLAIETALTLRLVFHLPLRQTEGFVHSLFALMDVELDVPDHTTLSRRSKRLRVDLRRVRRAEPVHLIIDSSGLSVVGQGEWAAAKHGGSGRRGWKKLHLGVDANGEILAQVLTDSVGDDASNGLDLIERVTGALGSITADPAYDTVAMYDAGARREARVIIPPSKTASASERRPRSHARDRTIRRVEKLGRRRWKRRSGYHRQGTVENAFFRYKSIIGDRLRARTSDAQAVEARLACEILNRMVALGRPTSVVIKP